MHSCTLKLYNNEIRKIDIFKFNFICMREKIFFDILLIYTHQNYRVIKYSTVLDDFEVPGNLRTFASRRGFTLSNNGGKFPDSLLILPQIASQNSQIIPQMSKKKFI